MCLWLRIPQRSPNPGQCNPQQSRIELLLWGQGPGCRTKGPGWDPRPVTSELITSMLKVKVFWTSHSGKKIVGSISKSVLSCLLPSFHAWQRSFRSVEVWKSGSAERRRVGTDGAKTLPHLCKRRKRSHGEGHRTSEKRQDWAGWRREKERRRNLGWGKN